MKQVLGKTYSTTKLKKLLKVKKKSPNTHIYT